MSDLAMATADALRRVITTGDPLTEDERGAIGPSGQLRVPLRDQVDLRRIATILRDVANKLEVCSHSRDSDFHVLIRAKMEIKAAQGRMSSQTRRR